MSGILPEKAEAVVIGAGISGLAAAVWLEHDHGVGDVVVLEADRRAGGRISTVVEDGFVLEGGPQGFLDNAPDTLELAEVAGLRERLVHAADASAARYIVRRSRPVEVPTSPGAFLRSPLLPLGGRLRVLGEPFARHRPEHDETVFDFARRRIGRAAADVLVDAMVTGVFAGNSRELSLAATFPRMAAMEAEHGSLTRALIARMRAARREGRRSGGPAGPGGTLTTLDRGMGVLPDRLAERLGPRLALGTRVTKLRPEGGGTVVATDRGEIRSRHVLLTTPAAATADLLADIAPQAVEPLEEMATVPVTVVMASYRGDAFPTRPEGFGFLVPRDEELGILGTLFCHSIFPDQAPNGTLLLRTMVGGAREPKLAGLDDAELVSHVRRALEKVLGADPAPTGTWIVRWPRAIAQYRVGHLDRVGRIETAARTAGVDVAGSAYRGVSVNDCIRQARGAARRLAAGDTA